ncbi:hypothetical protein AMAG_19854 [Allomyces macrogynus ATCC 38327]|uniref:Uncharacterized protein n=1 Tax=Allomyces macrogynus (strain ATCC 38327) TaxID=578462 RepID=A0A0L0T068_ALLM3|nr:hypothetical protein AMAG_19854 [Allomyces macrogynus ATCC 38327]|eukprot:KNE68166.1 hypothetical protein AMAG_19854 [Allomyces macrogynus ATCC 38327]
MHMVGGFKLCWSRPCRSSLSKTTRTATTSGERRGNGAAREVGAWRAGDRRVIAPRKIAQHHASAIPGSPSFPRRANTSLPLPLARTPADAAAATDPRARMVESRATTSPSVLPSLPFPLCKSSFMAGQIAASPWNKQHDA